MLWDAMTRKGTGREEGRVTAHSYIKDLQDHLAL